MNKRTAPPSIEVLSLDFPLPVSEYIHSLSVKYHDVIGYCSVCDPFAHAPLKELGGGNVWMPQKYTSSQHGNKCLEEEIRSVTKVGFVSKDKASFVRKDTTGT